MAGFEEEVIAARRRKGKRRRRNRVIKFTVVAFLEVILLAIILVCNFIQSKYNKIYVPPLPTNESGDNVIETNSYADQTYQEVVLKKFSTYLVIGVDATRQDKLVSGTNADVLILVSINNETKEVRMLSVYRDTHVLRGDDTMGKINSEMTHRGAYSTISLFNRNYDLNIDGFISVNWAAVANLINDLGGVELEIKENMMELKVDGEIRPYLNGLITQIVESTGIPSSHILEPGIYNCDGVQTVAYCRLRKKDSDFMRTQRQREVISKLLVKAKGSSLGTLNEAANHLLSGIAIGSTDADDPNASAMIDYFMGFIPKLGSVQIVDSMGFPFVHRTVMGYMKNDVMPINLEANVQAMHQFLYGTENYECSDFVKQLSEQMRIEGGFDENFNYIGQ